MYRRCLKTLVRRTKLPHWRSSARRAFSVYGRFLAGTGAVAAAAGFASDAFAQSQMGELESDIVDSRAIENSRVFLWGNPLAESDDSKANACPEKYASFDGAAALKIVCGGDNVAVISKYGELYTFGRGNNGVLGHEEASSESSPRLVEALADLQVQDVAVSNFHMAAVTASGEVFCWGRNWMGQLGIPKHVSEAVAPSKVSALRGIKARSVACGRNHTLVVDDDGRVFAFGSNSDGQLGVGDRDAHDEPVLVKGLDGVRVKQVTAGKGFSLFLTESGEVFSAGCDEYGELGHGSVGRQMTPKKISGFRRAKIASISCGEFHCSAVAEDGRVFCWGLGKDGQIGQDKNTNESRPTLVSGLNGKMALVSACGEGHTAVVTEKGDLYMWGRGRSGQLGRGDQLESVASYRTSPQLVAYFQKRKLPVRAVSLGKNHTAAICW